MWLENNVTYNQSNSTKNLQKFLNCSIIIFCLKIDFWVLQAYKSKVHLPYIFKGLVIMPRWCFCMNKFISYYLGFTYTGDTLTHNHVVEIFNHLIIYGDQLKLTCSNVSIYRWLD